MHSYFNSVPKVGRYISSALQ